MSTLRSLFLSFLIFSPLCLYSKTDEVEDLIYRFEASSKEKHEAVIEMATSIFNYIEEELSSEMPFAVFERRDNNDYLTELQKILLRMRIIILEGAREDSSGALYEKYSFLMDLLGSSDENLQLFFPDFFGSKNLYKVYYHDAASVLYLLYLACIWAPYKSDIGVVEKMEKYFRAHSHELIYKHYQEAIERFSKHYENLWNTCFQSYYGSSINQFVKKPENSSTIEYKICRMLSQLLQKEKEKFDTHPQPSLRASRRGDEFNETSSQTDSNFANPFPHKDEPLSLTLPIEGFIVGGVIGGIYPHLKKKSKLRKHHPYLVTIFGSLVGATALGTLGYVYAKAQQA